MDNTFEPELTDSPPRIGLVTFGGGKNNIRAAARRLARQAKKSERFTSILVTTDFSLKREHREFWELHKRILKPEVRGFGYWIWKPYLINHALRQWQGKVDFILYLDSGCEINSAPESQKRWSDYLVLMNGETGRLMMQQTCIEKDWQKMDAVVRLGMTEEAMESGQLAGAVLALRVDSENISLTNEWLQLCIEDNYHLVDDSPSRVPNSPHFIEHRHDQSILSGLVKRYGATVIPDETQWAPTWDVSGKSFPIWTPRNRTGISILDKSMVSKLRRLLVRISRKVAWEYRKAYHLRKSNH
jgi:hypothetical protein